MVRHLCRRLLQRIVILEPSAQRHLLGELLVVRDESGQSAAIGILPREPFTRAIVPELLKIMCIRETAVRLTLMTFFECFAGEIPKSTLKSVVLPEVCRL